MSKKTVKHDEEKVAEQAVEEATVKSVQFIEKYKKHMIAAAAIIIIAVLGIYSYKTFYKAPEIQASLDDMYLAEMNFQGDTTSLQQFEAVLAEHGGNTAESAHLYAAVSAMKIGQFDKAIEHLQKYEGEDAVLKARSLALIGDCYSCMEKYDDAVKAYEKAAKYVNNDFSAGYYMQAAIVLESQGKYAEALKIYQIIKDQYSTSAEGRQIEKYIIRANSKLAK